MCIYANCAHAIICGFVKSISEPRIIKYICYMKKNNLFFVRAESGGEERNAKVTRTSTERSIAGAL